MRAALPNLSSNEEAFQVIVEAIQKAGYEPGKDIFMAIDAAASEFYDEKTGKYELTGEGKSFTSEQLVDFYVQMVEKYPIISIEDGLNEEDWDGWKILTEK